MSPRLLRNERELPPSGSWYAEPHLWRGAMTSLVIRMPGRLCDGVFAPGRLFRFGPKIRKGMRIGK